MLLNLLNYIVDFFIIIQTIPNGRMTALCFDKATK